MTARESTIAEYETMRIAMNTAWTLAAGIQFCSEWRNVKRGFIRVVNGKMNKFC